MKWVIGILSIAALVYLTFPFSSEKPTRPILPASLSDAESEITFGPEAIVHIAAARELSRAGKNEEAFAHVETALKLEPDNQGLVILHGKLKKALDAEIAMKPEPEIEAEKAEWKAALSEGREFHSRQLEKDPGSARKHYEYSEYLLGRGEYGEADKELQETLKLQPDYPQADAMKQAINKVAEEKDPEYRGLTGILELPKVSPPFESKFELLSVPGETPQETERKVREEIDAEDKRLRSRYQSFESYESSPTESIRTNLISFYGFESDWEGAAQQFGRLAKEYPQSPNVPAKYADALVFGRRYDEALTVVSQAQERFPKDVQLKVIADLLNEVRQGTLPPLTASLTLSNRLNLMRRR